MFRISELSPDVQQAARMLWDYHAIPSDRRPSDFVLALGSNDIRVAGAAAELLLSNLAPKAVMSGGFGRITASTSTVSEAERFACEAQRCGIPRSRILIEDRATNTGANFTNTKALLSEHGIHVSTGIFVTKPYMKRRALATANAQWSEVQWRPCSPEIGFDNYPDSHIDVQQMIELMVGDLQRIDLYAKQGLQVYQYIPTETWQAYDFLISKGYDRHVIKDKL